MSNIIQVIALSQRHSTFIPLRDEMNANEVILYRSMVFNLVY